MTTVIETKKFTRLASDTQIERTRQALEANNIHTIVAENSAEAKKKLFELIPDNAEVFVSKSATINNLDISEKIDRSGRYDSVRAKLEMMDRKTQNREMQKMGVTPEYMIGSIHAVTENGQVIIVSKTGSQLAGYVAGAAHVIWVVGAQKIVATLEAGLKRVDEYTLPSEEARAINAYGMDSSINKLLIVNKEFMPGRATLILVKENLGL